MTPDDFRHWATRIADWSADFLATIRDRRVRAAVKPGEIAARIPKSPPEHPEPFETIFADFEQRILDGMTHWQHPRFFAYFPANAAPPSVLAEYLTATLGAQCMLWQTSPAATELETVTLDWLRQAIGLPDGFHGVIQDSASSATLCAVLTMRERALDWASNQQGLSGQARLRIYCSAEVHSSIDKAVWIAGIGGDNLIKIPAPAPGYAMDVAALEDAIKADKAAGHRPAGIIAAIGGTGVGGSDDVSAVCDVAERHGLYVHVDAAWAGAAMICPEFRPMMAGSERANSFVFNPHKWLGVSFDCSAHFVRDPADLVRTLAIRPSYLETQGADGIINYSEWSVPLGRRFRALKLWFTLRTYGLEGLREMIRNHVKWSQALCETIRKEPDFEITTEPVLSLFTFRHAPEGVDDLDTHNLNLVNAINNDGRTYLTQTVTGGKTVIRFQAGQMQATEADVLAAWDVVREVGAACCSRHPYC